MATVVNDFVRVLDAPAEHTLGRVVEVLTAEGFTTTVTGGQVFAQRGQRPPPSPELVPMYAEVWVTGDRNGSVLRVKTGDDTSTVLMGPVRRNYERLVGELEAVIDRAMGTTASLGATG